MSSGCNDETPFNMDLSRLPTTSNLIHENANANSIVYGYVDMNI